MGNDLQTITGSNSLKILGSWGYDKPKLAKLVDEFLPGVSQRLPTRAERDDLAALVPHYEAAIIPADRASIRRMITKLAFGFPNAPKGTPDEIEARLEVYATALADVPGDILGEACVAALKTHTFFPVPAELRKLCTGMALRHWRLSRIKHLIDKHDREWREPEPVEPLSAEDQAKVDSYLRRIGIRADDGEASAA